MLLSHHPGYIVLERGTFLDWILIGILLAMWPSDIIYVYVCMYKCMHTHVCMYVCIYAAGGALVVLFYR